MFAHKFQASGSAIFHLDEYNDGQFIIASSNDNICSVWSREPWKLAVTYNGHAPGRPGDVDCAVLFGEKPLVASACNEDTEVHIWNYLDGSEVESILYLDSTVDFLVASKVKAVFAVGVGTIHDDTLEFFLYRSTDRQELWRQQVHAAVPIVKFTEGSEYLLVHSYSIGGSAVLLDVDNYGDEFVSPPCASNENVSMCAFIERTFILAYYHDIKEHSSSP